MPEYIEACPRCGHDQWEKDRDPHGGADTGDRICKKCGDVSWRGLWKQKVLGMTVPDAQNLLDWCKGQKPLAMQTLHVHELRPLLQCYVDANNAKEAP